MRPNPPFSQSFGLKPSLWEGFRPCIRRFMMGLTRQRRIGGGLLLALLFSLGVEAQFQAAYMDMQKAIQSTQAGKKAKAQLEKAFNKKKEELKKKEGKIKKEAEAFQKKSSLLSDKARREKQEALQKQMFEFQQEVQKSQANIQQEEQKLTRPILEKLQKIVDQVAKEKGYSMVFEKSGQAVMWAKSDLDITQDVVKAFEKKAK